MLADRLGIDPNSTNGGTSQFVSARSAPGEEVQLLHQGASDADSFSSGECTAPRGAPSGLRVKVRVDQDGIHYVEHPETGIRFDVSDDEAVPLVTPYYDPNPAPYRHPNAVRTAGSPAADKNTNPPSRSTTSTASDLAFTSSTSPQATTPPEDMLGDLVRDLAPEMTGSQKAKYAARRALDQNLHDIEAIGDDTATKLHGIYLRVTSQDDRLAACLEDNLRVLRCFGSTTAQIEELTRIISSNSVHSSPKPTLPALPSSDSRSSTPLDDLRTELDAALPPQGPHESDDAFKRRATSAVKRKERTAAAFGMGSDPATTSGAPSASAAHFA
ncbi:hypothetical protein C8J57DRAFT_1517865 [Mycena rebaudengoi]|nr:hypothetical protein C8J57DRAFT_1517865 [Mycena rebaudengoi]